MTKQNAYKVIMGMKMISEACYDSMITEKGEAERCRNCPLYFDGECHENIYPGIPAIISIYKFKEDKE